MVEQQTQKRINKLGLTSLDEEKACPGFVVYCPTRSTKALIIDLCGNIVHQWNLKYQPGLYGYLLPNGNLFYNGKTQHTRPENYMSWGSAFKGGILQEITPEGEVIWEHKDPYHHHDGRKTSSGGAIYLDLEPVPKEIASRVKGGVPGSDENGMWSDLIKEVNSDGEVVWEWHSYEHFDPETDKLLHNMKRVEWTHGNSVAPIGDDKVLASFRNISTVAIIDKKSDEIVWRLGYDVLAQQHDPSMLSNGNILIFDNGLCRKNETWSHSRVVEVNPSGEIVWEYKDSPDFNFYSCHISGARRLVNGNTLIIEGGTGRMFQVTRECEVVWEYINPYFHESEQRVLNTIFKANHYQKNEIPFL
jgi:SepF-like predicted cell division protein (DUF552 family)